MKIQHNGYNLEIKKISGNRISVICLNPAEDEIDGYAETGIPDDETLSEMIGKKVVFKEFADSPNFYENFYEVSND